MWARVELCMSNRAIRRHHRERLKNRLRKILSSREFYSMYNPGWTKDLEYQVNIRWNNMQMCSCSCCGNPRRKSAGWGYEPQTIQEKRANCDYKDQLFDLDIFL